jgi:hypothetical protein
MNACSNISLIKILSKFFFLNVRHVPVSV